MILCDACLANLNSLFLAVHTTHIDTHLLWLGLVAVVTGDCLAMDFSCGCLEGCVGAGGLLHGYAHLLGDAVAAGVSKVIAQGHQGGGALWRGQLQANLSILPSLQGRRGTKSTSLKGLKATSHQVWTAGGGWGGKQA